MRKLGWLAESWGSEPWTHSGQKVEKVAKCDGDTKGIQRGNKGNTKEIQGKVAGFQRADGGLPDASRARAAFSHAFSLCSRAFPPYSRCIPPFDFVFGGFPPILGPWNRRPPIRSRVDPTRNQTGPGLKTQNGQRELEIDVHGP